MLPSIFLNVIFFIVAWMFRSKWFKIKVHIRNSNTSSILTKQSCLLKITWPKKVIPTKSYSLAMLYLHHTKYLNHAQPWWQAKQLFHTFDVLKLFQFSRNTWAWAMDIALCGIKGPLWWRQKEGKIVSHQLGVSMGYGDAPQYISMWVSRDCHATDALELYVYESSTKETKWVCIQLACSRRPREFWGSPSLEYTSQVL